MKAMVRLGHQGVILGILLGWATAGWGQGKVSFKESNHHFGDIKEEEGLVEIIFPFENTGNAAVVLEQVKTSCGCTTPIYSRDSVAPGSQGFVKVQYNPLNRPGSFKKQIVVYNSGTTPIQTLHISGRVIPRPKGPQDFYPFKEGNLRFRTNHLTYGRLYKDEEETLSTVVYNDGERPVRFNRARSIFPPHLIPQMSKGELAPGDTVHLVVTYKAELKEDWGFVFDNFFLATDDPDRPMKRFNVTADILERFPESATERAQMGKLRLDKATHDFGKVTDSAEAVVVFRLDNTGKGPLFIRKASSGCSCLEIEVAATEIAPGEGTEMRVRFDMRGRVGREDKEVVLISSDPNQPQRIIKIYATVERAD